MEQQDKIWDDLTGSDYKYGFVTDIDTETIPKGLNEDIVRLISQKKGEPDWMTEFRLKAYRHWRTLSMPRWAHLDIPEIDFQDIIYWTRSCWLRSKNWACLSKRGCCWRVSPWMP